MSILVLLACSSQHVQLVISYELHRTCVVGHCTHRHSHTLMMRKINKVHMWRCNASQDDDDDSKRICSERLLCTLSGHFEFHHQFSCRNLYIVCTSKYTFFYLLFHIIVAIYWKNSLDRCGASTCRSSVRILNNNNTFAITRIAIANKFYKTEMSSYRMYM